MATVVLACPIGDPWDRTYRRGSQNCNHLFNPVYKHCPECARVNKPGDIETSKRLKSYFIGPGDRTYHSCEVIDDKPITYVGYEVCRHPEEKSYWVIHSRYVVPPLKDYLASGIPINHESERISRLPGDMISSLESFRDTLHQAVFKDDSDLDASKTGIYVWPRQLTVILSNDAFGDSGIVNC